MTATLHMVIAPVNLTCKECTISRKFQCQCYVFLSGSLNLFWLIWRTPETLQDKASFQNNQSACQLGRGPRNLNDQSGLCGPSSRNSFSQGASVLFTVLQCCVRMSTSKSAVHGCDRLLTAQCLVNEIVLCCHGDCAHSLWSFLLQGMPEARRVFGGRRN